MTNALDDVDAAFTKQTGVKVVTSYDARSALVDGNIKKRNAPKVRLSPPCRAKSIKRKAALDAGPLRYCTEAGTNSCVSNPNASNNRNKVNGLARFIGGLPSHLAPYPPFSKIVRRGALR